jgi:hypothetical protein
VNHRCPPASEAPWVCKRCVSERLHQARPTVKISS